MKKRLTLLALSAFLASCVPESPDFSAPEPEPVEQVAEEPDDQPTTDPVPEKPQAGEYILPLIETTDIHGYVLSADGNGIIHYRMAYLADKVKDIRGRGQDYRKDRLLLLDGGDLYQGASVSNFLAGRPVYVSMDKMGYDAVALGNHEFDWGLDQTVDADATLPDYDWEGRRCANVVPVLCANLFRNGSRASCTRDYVVVEKTAVNAKGGTVPIRIGVVGFAVNYEGSIIATQFSDQGYSVTVDYGIANRIASELESSGECDATVLLIHGAADDAAAALGRGTDIDLVLGGHTHWTLSGKTEWGLSYLQGGRYLEHYAGADLVFSVDDDGAVSFTRVDGMSVETVDSARDSHRTASENAEDLDDEILAVSEEALSATGGMLNDVIGHINVGATSYYIDGSGGRAAIISNWMCDILRRIGGADVAFVNAGGIRTYFSLEGQSSRNITVANVYEMFPFGNPTYVYRITYADLLKVFEYSMTSGGEVLFSRMTGIDCLFTETDHGSYSTYAVYALRKGGETIYQKGKWTGDWASRSVTLAVSEYLAIAERTDYYTGTPNPLVEWNKTDKLISNDRIDNVCAVEVLRTEAASSGGLLWIDTKPYFIQQ